MYITMPNAHCMRCMKKTKDVGGIVKIAKNGARMNHSTCSLCGTHKCSILPQKGIQHGNGKVTDFIKRFLPKPSSVLKAASYLPVVGDHFDVLSKFAKFTVHGLPKRKNRRRLA